MMYHSFKAVLPLPMTTNTAVQIYRILVLFKFCFALFDIFSKKKSSQNIIATTAPPKIHLKMSTISSSSSDSSTTSANTTMIMIEISSLPDLCMLTIFHHLSVSDLKFKCSFVSRHWSVMVSASNKARRTLWLSDHSARSHHHLTGRSNAPLNIGHLTPVKVRRLLAEFPNISTLQVTLQVTQAFATLSTLLKGWKRTLVRVHFRHTTLHLLGRATEQLPLHGVGITHNSLTITDKENVPEDDQGVIALFQRSTTVLAEANKYQINKVADGGSGSSSLELTATLWLPKVNASSLGFLLTRLPSVTRIHLCRYAQLPSFVVLSLVLSGLPSLTDLWLASDQYLVDVITPTTNTTAAAAVVAQKKRMDSTNSNGASMLINKTNQQNQNNNDSSTELAPFTPLPSIRSLCLTLPRGVCRHPWYREGPLPNGGNGIKHLSEDYLGGDGRDLSAILFTWLPFGRMPNGRIFPALTSLIFQSEWFGRDLVPDIVRRVYAPPFLAACPALKQVAVADSDQVFQDCCSPKDLNFFW